MIPLDDELRPTWLFGQTVHEGCDRGGYYEQGEFATEYGSPQCLVKLGCWGPVVKCNVPKRGWMNGIGGCPNVGGICIGCTMPGFPDKFMPFMDEPPGGKVSGAASGAYGGVIRRLRKITATQARQGTEVAAPGPRADHRLPKVLVRAGAMTTTQPKPAEHRHRQDRPHRDVLGSDHPDRRQPRHLHEDRLRAEAGRRVPQHVVDLPRLQRLHEGQGPARRALHHQPHLRHLRRQPRHLLGLRPEHGLRRRGRRTSAEWIINLGEAAEYMFDHNIFQENLVGVDYCEKMVAETNPGVLEQANRTEAPHAAEHGYRTIADIMRALNPLEGEFYREALQVSRYTREMFCLMEGRHVHPSTLYPGGVGTVATVQLFTDYLTRLMRYVEFMKRVVPMHDDLFDFFYEALPGYEEVGRRRVLLGCWGAFNDPEHCDFHLRTMTDWGRKMFVTPGVVVDGKLVTNDLVDINLGIRILLGSSFYDDWEGQEMFVDARPAGQPGRPRATRGTSTRSRRRRSATSTTSTAG